MTTVHTIVKKDEKIQDKYATEVLALKKTEGFHRRVDYIHERVY
jgi:hypothetical protein